jgi:hypothetical protein
MSSPPHSLPQPELPHGFCCSHRAWRGALTGMNISNPVVINLI